MNAQITEIQDREYGNETTDTSKTNAYKTCSYHLAPEIKHAILTLLITFISILVTTDAMAMPADRPENSSLDKSIPPKPPHESALKPLQPRNQLDETAIESQLQNIVVTQNLLPLDVGALALPSIHSDKAQLGKKLFFSKNLGGEQSAACVSCHHPSLGGGDNLSLSVGVNAIDSLGNDAHDLLGQGRFNGNDINNLPTVPRNAPTIFNLGLLTQGLFWDSRVERTPQGEILTPDSLLDNDGVRLPDSSLLPDTTLAAAQARFPVTSIEELRGGFAQNESNEALRNQLTNRFDNSLATFITNWTNEFANVYQDALISFDLIADAIGEYERSMIFVNNPWQNYLAGDSNALTTEQKAGAILFFAAPQEGGAGCMFCHNGPAFSDSRHHLVAFPQIGPGKGDDSASNTSQDFGRENITNNEADKFHFRTASLLNVEVTAPYGHTGSYQSLHEVVRHYNGPNAAITKLFGAEKMDMADRNNVAEGVIDGTAPFCQLPQIKQLIVKTAQSCQQLYPDAYTNSREVTRHLTNVNNDEANASSPLFATADLNKQEINHLVAFLEALTDPCVKDRDCLLPWIVTESEQASFPDNQPLIAVDKLEQIL